MKRLVLALLLAGIARADTVDCTVAITPVGDPISSLGLGRVGAIYSDSFSTSNEFVFWVEGANPFTVTGNEQLLTFIPGEYAIPGTETMSITDAGAGMVNFFFTIIPHPLPGDTAPTLTFDFALPDSVVPIINLGTGDRYYIDNVSLTTGFIPDPPTALSVPVATPEPGTLLLLIPALIAFVILMWRPRRLR